MRAHPPSSWHLEERPGEFSINFERIQVGIVSSYLSFNCRKSRASGQANISERSSLLFVHLALELRALCQPWLLTRFPFVMSS